jgi:hypothetical protein
MKKPWLLALALLAVCAVPVFAGGDKEAVSGTGTAGSLAGQKSIMINEPELVGFSQTGDSDLPGYIQNALEDNFINYAKMRTAGQDVPDYFLYVRIQKHSPIQYSLRLTVSEKVNVEGIASSMQYANKLDQLKYGAVLNLATRDLLDNSTLGVKLTAEARKALEKPRDTKYDESQAAIVRASASPEASFRREQNANVAEDLGASLARAGLQLSDSSGERFELPEFSAPQFAALSFQPPTIRAFSTGSSVSAIRTNYELHRAAQAASKAAIEEQQQYLDGQRADILGQWQNFLGEIDKRRELLRGEVEKLFQAQETLEAQLREGEANYHASPPFRILYDPTPKQDVYNARGTVNFSYQIAAEPTSLRALKVRVDNLLALNKSFEKVNHAYEDVNTAMAERFAQVEIAMNAVKDAMERANTAGRGLDDNYKVDPVSITSGDWAIPPGNEVNGEALKTSWPVEYPRQFNLTVCLLIVNGDEAEVIKRMPLSLISDFSWNGPFQPESVSARGSFNDVKIDDLPEEGFPTIWIEAVNNKDAETAAVEGYIEIIPDGERTAAVEKQIVARKSSRAYWSDTQRFSSLGLAIGTNGLNASPPSWVGEGFSMTPLLLVSVRATLSPFRAYFLEAGSDFGMFHGEQDVKDINYLSIAPYLHLNTLFRNGFKRDDSLFPLYIGIGGGGVFTWYTYPSESGVDPVMIISPVFDFNIGYRLIFTHSVIDLRYTLKTNFKEKTVDLVTLSYAYRFGYFKPRYGGDPAKL